MDRSILNYINGGDLGSDILNDVTTFTEELVKNLVKEKGISIANNTMEKLYNFSEVFARQLTDTIAAESLNDTDFNVSDKRKTDIYLP